jgi:hypothetical protein
MLSRELQHARDILKVLESAWVLINLFQFRSKTPTLRSPPPDHAIPPGPPSCTTQGD